MKSHKDRARVAADRLNALGYAVAARELRECYGIEEEWPDVVLEDILDTEYITEE